MFEHPAIKVVLVGSNYLLTKIAMAMLVSKFPLLLKLFVIVKNYLVQSCAMAFASLVLSNS